MENYSYSSYPDSGDSSPRSREIDNENQSWDEPIANYKVKFMCSYGGKIQPRPHDNQLAYVGGDTKILAVERNIKFNAIMTKLSALYGDDNVCFKYQLPGEDLDALISVTNDEDLEHMMLEYDRLYRASAKPVRLRLFLFALNPKMSSAGVEPKSDRQWFVDALNSVQIQTLEGSSPSTVVSATNPDFLFGFDKPKMAETPPEVVGKDVTAGLDCGSEDRHVIGDQLSEIQRQELQRLSISGLEQANQIPRGSYAGAGQLMAPPPGAIPMPMQMQIPAAAYLPERRMTAGNYPTEQQQQQQQPVYIIPATAPHPGVYSTPTLRPPTSQAYYEMPRVVQEQPMYNYVPASAPAPGDGSKIGGYSVQVGYDGAGRQVYYTTTTAAPAGGMAAQYQQLNQEGKVVVSPKPPQTSSI